MTNGSLPTNRELIIPTVIALKQLGGKGTNEQIFNKICVNERFTQSQLNIRKTNDEGKGWIENNADWARTILRGAEIIYSPSRTMWQLIDMNINPNSLDKEVVYETYNKNKNKKTKEISTVAVPNNKGKVATALKTIIDEPEILVTEDNKDYCEFYKENISKKEIAEIRDIANKLNSHLKKKETIQLIKDKHIVEASSKVIQDIILPFATGELNFISEKKGLFNDYRLRPDYYLKTSTSGILLEVERGKTITNNMDLLDLWKCHICEEAKYLFLIVPKIRVHRDGKKTNIFPSVCKRIESFFVWGNYVNVNGVVIFGY